MSPSSQPEGSPARELFPAIWAGREEVPPEARPVEQHEVGGHEATGLVEELLTAARQAVESVEVIVVLIAKLLSCISAT